MNGEEDQTTINYYLRKQWYQHVITYCDAKLKKRLSEPMLILWKSLALIKQDKSTEAILELEQLQERRDMVIAGPLANIYAHERAKLVDYEAISAWKAKLDIAVANTNLTEKAQIFAALFYWHTDRISDAQQVLKTVLQSNGSSNAAYALMGWIDLTSNTKSISMKSISWFEKALDRNPKDLEALLGKMQYVRRERRLLSPALDLTSQIIVYFPACIVPLIERMNILLEMAAWDQVVEAAQRINGVSPENIEALATICLAELCREGTSQMASSHIATLYQAVIRTEPKNPELFYSLVRPFVRLSNRQPSILDPCQKMIEKAIALEDKVSSYHTELGYILFLLGQTLRARESYNTACRLDPQNISALEGMLRCQIDLGHYDAAEEQLAIFNQLSNTMGQSAQIAYLNSLLAWKKHGDSYKRLHYLKEAVGIQLQLVNSCNLSADYYVSIDPDFLLEIVKHYMDHCISDGNKDSVRLQPVIRIVQDLLEVICRIVPGSSESLYYLAKAKLLMGDTTGAELALASCIKHNESNSKAYLLMAEIHMSNSLYKAALSSLETALGYNFDIRHQPEYHILKSRALKLNGLWEEALGVAKNALLLPAAKDMIKSISKREWTEKNGTSGAPNLPQLGSLYLELIDIYGRQKRLTEANQAMIEATSLFESTTEAPRFRIAQAELLLSGGDTNGALSVLSQVRPDQLYFLEAKSRMADIYLKYKNDRKNYALCYSEMVEKHPTVESCLLLGDAYMNIQEPEQAVAVYQSAFISNPEQTILASKIGKALEKTHDYNRAIAYYQSALESDSNASLALQYDLADLLRKLKRYDEAERVLLTALNHEAVEEVSILAMDSKFQQLLAQVYNGQQQPDKAIQTFLEARESFNRLLCRDDCGDKSVLTALFANVLFELAELVHIHQRDYERAVQYYVEALQHNPTHRKAHIALAKLYIKKQDLASAQTHLAKMIKLEVATDEAAMMLADLMSKKSTYESAKYHFTQLLERDALHFEAFARFIDLARRNGQIDDALPLFEAAEKSSKKAKMMAGYHFCMGLYQRYSSNQLEAMKSFVACRRDHQFGERALHHLIDLFLNPDDQTLGGEALVTGSDTPKTDFGDDQSESDLLGVLSADKLIKELPQKPKSLRTQVYECMALIATKQKDEIERAITILMEILNKDRDFIPALYATSVAFMLLKQPPRARNQLKRISKVDFEGEYADDVEKSWLLLADIYIQGGKYDLATDLLKKVIEHNKSCGKAWEYLGFIMEKESAYKDAADHYSKAWKQGRERNPAIGFKLAFNFLKAKRYVDAIDVCHKVMKTHPDYPRIQKDIMEKARSQLRCP